jgi:hypothetical protein
MFYSRKFDMFHSTKSKMNNKFRFEEEDIKNNQRYNSPKMEIKI